jgi:hypothetical protein
MTCNCNCGCNQNGNRLNHRVLKATAGTTLALTTTFSNNVNDKDFYKFFASGKAIGQLPETPVEVTVEVGGTQVPIWNKYGDPLLSSAIPDEAVGYYSETPTPHVSLVNTPQTITIP